MQTNSNKSNKGHTFLIPAFYNPKDWQDLILDQKTYTYDDYKKLPEGAPYQLIGGKLITTPAPEVYHQDISAKLGFKLQNHVMSNEAGKVYYAPIDVQFSEIEVYQPDIIFIHKKNMEIIGKKKIEGPPDVVIEILSPSTAYYDLREKYRVYEKYGVKEYWIVDPEIQKVEIYENINNKFNLNNEAEARGSISSIVLEKFTVLLTDIF